MSKAKTKESSTKKRKHFFFLNGLKLKIRQRNRRVSNLSLLTYKLKTNII